MADAASPTRECGERGCGRPHRARGLCSTHYNASRYTTEQRRKKHAIPCTWCARVCMKENRSAVSARFCSLSCRDTWRRRDRLPVLYVGTVCAPDPRPAVAKPRPARRWVAGRCRHCGTTFVDRQPDARYCSTRCGRRYWRTVRKDDVPPLVRLYVLERDGWRCQLCRRGIPATLTVPHPKAGTVDHVIPRSQHGSNDPANLRAAHHRCNQLRGNRGGGEQLALLG